MSNSVVWTDLMLRRTDWRMPEALDTAGIVIKPPTALPEAYADKGVTVTAWICPCPVQASCVTPIDVTAGCASSGLPVASSSETPSPNPTRFIMSNSFSRTDGHGIDDLRERYDTTRGQPPGGNPP